MSQATELQYLRLPQCFHSLDNTKRLDVSLHPLGVFDSLNTGNAMFPPEHYKRIRQRYIEDCWKWTKIKLFIILHNYLNFEYQGAILCNDFENSRDLRNFKSWRVFQRKHASTFWLMANCVLSANHNLLDIHLKEITKLFCNNAAKIQWMLGLFKTFKFVE